MAKSTAQQMQPDTAQPETLVVGLPIYCSDGTKIGEVTQVGMHDGQQTVAAQLEPSLMGAKVLIPAKLMTQQDDRLELPMTTEQVKTQISKP
jgi:sporulation protein YlmC with PRC-barrel domain